MIDPTCTPVDGRPVQGDRPSPAVERYGWRGADDLHEEQVP